MTATQNCTHEGNARNERQIAKIMMFPLFSPT
jgi:hypothetical protein